MQQEQEGEKQNKTHNTHHTTTKGGGYFRKAKLSSESDQL